MAQRLSDGLKDALHDAFDKVDAEQIGSLNQDGVRQVLQLIGQNPTQAEMRRCFKQFGNDTVDRDSITTFVENHFPLKSQEKINDEIAEAFAKFETNGDYVISKADFREILTKLGDEPLTEGEADAILACLDQTTDKIHVSDLSKLMSG